MRIFGGGEQKQKREKAAKKLGCLRLMASATYSPLCLFLLATLGIPQ